MMKPLAIDLFCGCFGWSAGWLEFGGHVVGFDLEHLPHHGPVPKGADLVIQDVLTLHGSQFRDASLITASPPCQFFSYTAMPWSRAKKLARDVRADPERTRQATALFDACFRIQHEAIEAAGHHIPLVVENVRGAIPWVGRSRWNFGSFHLWGDVPVPMPMPMTGGRKNKGGSWFNIGSPGQKETNGNPVHGPIVARRSAMKVGITHRVNGETSFHRDAYKTRGIVFQRDGYSHTRHLTNQAESAGIKQGGEWWRDLNGLRAFSSKSLTRKAASAMIAKIPYPLARYIAWAWMPRELGKR